MARWEFSWVDDDGQIIRRFSRTLSTEAWLVARDLDNPGWKTPPIVTAVQVGSAATVADALKLAIDAVNNSLRFIETRETLVTRDEQGVVETVEGYPT